MQQREGLSLDRDNLEYRRVEWYVILIASTLFPTRPFPSCFEPHYGSEAKCKNFNMKISFYSYAKRHYTNLHIKSFALNLAFMMRFTATRNGPFLNQRSKPTTQYRPVTRILCGGGGGGGC